jgi:hypothetical protein
LTFTGLKATDLADPQLNRLNEMFRQIKEAVNDRMGVNGPVQFLSSVDLKNNRITNVGAPVEPTDALSKTSADPMYSVPVQQAAMEIVGTQMLQTTRRLNDGTQQHGTSGDLKTQGSVPPTFMGSLTYSGGTGPSGSIQWRWDELQIQHADGTTVVVPQGSITITHLSVDTQYSFYPYLNTHTLAVEFVVDTTNALGTPAMAFPGSVSQSAQQNAAAVQNADGHLPLALGAILASTGMSGGGGGNNCKHHSMVVESKTRGLIGIVSVVVGEQLKARRGGWTTVTKKTLGMEKVFIKIVCSNGESLLVTPSDPVVVWGSEDSVKAQELSLSQLLVGVDENDSEYPVQIMELSPVLWPGTTVLLSCDPTCEYLIGSHQPVLVAHNYLPPK